MPSSLPLCFPRLPRGRNLPEEFSQSSFKIPREFWRQLSARVRAASLRADGCSAFAGRGRLPRDRSRCTDTLAGRLADISGTSSGQEKGSISEMHSVTRVTTRARAGLATDEANSERLLRTHMEGGSISTTPKVSEDNPVSHSRVFLPSPPVSARPAPFQVVSVCSCAPMRLFRLPARGRGTSTPPRSVFSSLPSLSLPRSPVPFLVSPASSVPNFSQSPSSRGFSVASRIHFLNSRTRFQTAVHASDVAPPFLLLPLASPRPLLAYHHRFRTRNRKRGSRFHPHPLPLPPPPLSPPRSDAAHLFAGKPLAASAVSTAAGQQTLPPPLLRHLQGLFPVFRGPECDPSCGVGPAGEAAGLALLPPPSLVEPRHLEDLARRALQARGETRDAASGACKSDRLFWRELAARVEKVRDLLPIESLVRLLTILTLNGASGTVRPVKQIFQAFETQDEDTPATPANRTGLRLASETLPCVRPLPPRLLLASTREFLEDLKKLSPPATAALAATFAWSNCTSSALLFALMERWAWRQPRAEPSVQTDVESEVKPLGKRREAETGLEEEAENAKKLEAVETQGHLGDFTPADFALFVSALGHLLSQQEATQVKYSRQARHLREISGKQIMAAFREQKRQKGKQTADANFENFEETKSAWYFTPAFFDGCCRFMETRAESFSLFSFASAARTLVENLDTVALVGEAAESRALAVDGEGAGSVESLGIHGISTFSSFEGSVSRSEKPHVACPTPDSVEALAKAISLFVASWDGGDKTHARLAARAANLLLVARLLRAASQCELYIHLHRALRLEAEGSGEGKSPQKRNSGEQASGAGVDDGGRGVAVDTVGACKTLLEHISCELGLLHSELEALPLLNSTLEDADDSADEKKAVDAPTERGFVHISPDTVYVRNELLAAAGESAAAVVRLHHAKSLLQTTDEVARDSQSLRKGEAENVCHLSTGARVDRVKRWMRGQQAERMQLEMLGELKSEAEHLADAIDRVLRERGAAGLPTEQLADLMEVFALCVGDKRGSQTPAETSRWFRLGLGDKAEKMNQANLSSLQALSSEIVRRYAALDVNQKRRIKWATRQMDWKDPYLNHCLGRFTAAVTRQRAKAANIRK
ncbi:hypothetical protein TGMAS_223500 [Toxoplasma gondii MAS]|uniref:Uncharacterized protein n=1 Tax=Toxoplasma gondii MAS TaxID=943118 RepID=A0A086PL59_TOXGO|nr:hypothetical protein TGMAS_223500 [Toxoplasma gondii MAS]